MRRKGARRATEKGGYPRTALPRQFGWRTLRDRLAWAVALVQREPREMTPGDRENLRLGLWAFPIYLPSDRIGLLPPDEQEVREILKRFGDMIAKAARREEIERRGKPPLILSWNSQTGRYTELARLADPDACERTLWILLREYGHLVKDCPAPAVRAKAGETCGVRFVAKRPNQDYCSATCQSRASTRAARAGTETPAARLRGKGGK